MFAAHDITHDGVVFRDDCVTVTAAENSHFAHPSYGPDGVRERSYSYRFDTKSGSVVFTGDTGPSAAVTRLARGADLLVSEVNDQQAVKDLRRVHDALTYEGEEHMRREHLTPIQVAEMARAARVRTVILTHIVGGGQGANAIAAQVKRHFPGTVIEGTDLLNYIVGK
jgi:ribonuclease BN (tRNA processing enzyme)